MAVYAIVDPSTNVTNLVLWDGESEFDVQPNTLVATNDNPNAQIGGTYVNGQFFPAPPQQTE